MSKLLLAAAFMLVPVGMSQNVAAQPNNDKVTICHRTNSVKNPYVKNTVSKNAVNGQGGNGDHFAEHQGPLASSEAVARSLKDSQTKWGDIIPPVPGVHGGLNWTAEGQAMYNNDCNYVQAGQPAAGRVLAGTTQSANNTGQAASQIPVTGAESAVAIALGTGAVAYGASYARSLRRVKEL